MNDYIRSPGYGITAGSTNTYTLTLNPSLTSYTAGVCIAVKIHAANTGASTININGLGAKCIKDSKGNNLTSGKLVLNSIYTLRYDGANFILQGEGGEYGTATASDVLAGKTIGTENGLLTGSIQSKPSQTYPPSISVQTISPGQYLSGTQTIAATAGTAIASDVLSGKTFNSASGIELVGTIPSKGAQTYNPGTANQTIAAGQYLSGIQTIAGSPNLVEGNIKKGVNIFGKVGTLNGLSFLTSASELDAGRDGTSNRLSYCDSFSVYNGSYVTNAILFTVPDGGTGTITSNENFWIYISGSYIEKKITKTHQFGNTSGYHTVYNPDKNSITITNPHTTTRYGYIFVI